MTTMAILDTNWTGRAHAIGTALLESGGHRFLVDPGPASTLATLRERLAERGLSVSDIEGLLLTHIHLDHAGASGAMVRENPRLAVYVHEKGAAHMADPAKLVSSAARLWGDKLEYLFGEMVPVPRENLRVLRGGETLTLGSELIEVEYTPGHASHHVTYFDVREGVAYAGDTTGVRIDGGPYILPATPPPDIDLSLWDESLAKILARKPQRLFLTHYGFVDHPAAHIAEFQERLHHWLERVGEILRTSSDESSALRTFLTFAHTEISRYLPAEEGEHYAFTAGLDLSFLGLARHIRKRDQAAASSSGAAI
jgi:glyoxylase-like metal-dependent hydrolase (beta-lactamase superfamily II)